MAALPRFGLDFGLACLPSFLGVPPRGAVVVKSPMVATDSEIGLAKYVQPWGLRLNSCQQMTY